MKSLAFFSPLSPLPGGVAAYADRLAARLAEKWDITFYVDDGYEPTLADEHGRIENHRNYRGVEDLTLFQASNGPMHSYMYPYIVEHGGVMTLHDSTLHDMVMTWWEGRSRAQFWRDFIVNEGLAGLMRALSSSPGAGIWPSKRILWNLYLDEEGKREKFRFFRRVMSRAGGIITHSEWVARIAREFGAHCTVMTVPLAVETPPPRISIPEARELLRLDESGIGNDTFVALAYGHIQSHKRILPILEAWKKFVAETPDCMLMLIGPRSPDIDIDAEVIQRDLEDRVFIDSSYPPLEKVYRYLYAADFCLNLRKPVYGSTSQTLMEILAAGRACAVTDLETFSEFPDDIVVKISAGNNESGEVFDALRRAREDPEGRESMGKRARAYIEEKCLWGLVGKRYNDYLFSVL